MYVYRLFLFLHVVNKTADYITVVYVWCRSVVRTYEYTTGM